MEGEETRGEGGGGKGFGVEELQVDCPLVLEHPRELKGAGEVAPGVGGQERERQGGLEGAAEHHGPEELRGAGAAEAEGEDGGRHEEDVHLDGDPGGEEEHGGSDAAVGEGEDAAVGEEHGEAVVEEAQEED